MNARILPWPPQPWPPEEPEPDDLDEPVDWLSYSHRELYEMAHYGLDLAGANAAAADWAGLGEALEDIGLDLRQAIAGCAPGWQGEAADQARDTMNRLAGWTSDTARRAGSVSDCVTRQAEHAETARRMMPPPPAGPLPPREPIPAGGTVAMSASPFTGGFGDAAALVTDPAPDRERDHEQHRRAAEVMQQLQAESREVYRDVPNFAPPLETVTVLGDPDPSPQPEPTPPAVPSPAADPVDERTAAAAGGFPGSPVSGRDGFVGSSPVSGFAPPGSGPGGGSAEQLGAGGRIGAGRPAAQAGGAAGFTSGRGGSPASMGPMGMPMGTGGAGGRGEDSERTRPDYLEGDSDFWRPDLQVSPPVLGVDNPEERDR